MKLKQVLAKSALAAGVGLAAFGLGGGLANAEPPPPPPVPPIPDVPCVPAPDVSCVVEPPPVPPIPAIPPIPQPPPP
jgi:hypothetical protein